MNFAQNLKIAMEDMGITCAKLAELVDVTPITISNYRNNKFVPNEIVMERIARILHCTSEWLKGDSDVPVRVKRGFSITKVVRLAEKAGLSYGEYVSLSERRRHIHAPKNYLSYNERKGRKEGEKNEQKIKKH